MWLMNRMINPLVRLVLRSPLHGIMSSAVLLLYYQGKKSGKEYSLPVQYVREGEMLYIVPGSPDQKTWWRNFRGGVPVRLVLRGKTLHGQANLLSGERNSAEIAHALKLYFRRFPAAAHVYKLRAESDGGYNESDIQQIARSILMVQVRLDTAPVSR